MSQVTPTQPRIPISAQQGPTRAAWIGALLALTAAVVIALVIALGSESNDASAVGTQVLPALRADSGPDESAVAAAVGAGAQQSARPDESRVAAAVGASAQEPAARPDESRVAAAIAGR